MSETLRLFATAATADRIDAGCGVIWWATHPPGDYALTVLDYALVDMPAVNAAWLDALYQRSADLIATHKPAMRECPLRVEHPGLLDVLEHAEEARADAPAHARVDRSAVAVQPVSGYETAKWPATLDERAFAIRPSVDSGKIVKLETGLRRFSFRAIRTNHLVSQIKQHRPGNAESAGELLQAFVLGVLLATAPKTPSLIDYFDDRPDGALAPSAGPFGAGYIAGNRPR